MSAILFYMWKIYHFNIIEYNHFNRVEYNHDPKYLYNKLNENINLLRNELNKASKLLDENLSDKKLNGKPSCI